MSIAIAILTIYVVLVHLQNFRAHNANIEMWKHHLKTFHDVEVIEK